MRIFLGFLFFIAWASLARYAYVCNIKGLCGENPPEETTEDIRPKTLDLILDDSIKILEGYEQFAFPVNSKQPNLSDNNKVYLDSVAAYLLKDSLKNLTITGLFRESETGVSSGIHEDLGTARASGIRALLIQRSIPEERISLDFAKANDEKMSEPLQFNLYQPDDAIPEEYDKVQFSFKNMTYSDANFEVDSDVFAPGDAFKFYADSVKTYFELNPESTLTIIGHCDSDGTEQYNYDLGFRRAKNTKAYFVNLGLKDETILLESEGEKKPIAPNDTDENKQKNRRVNFIIQ